MIQAVADTHTVIWYLFADSRLSLTARNTIGIKYIESFHKKKIDDWRSR